jgi:hypothetical protein
MGVVGSLLGATLAYVAATKGIEAQHEVQQEQLAEIRQADSRESRSPVYSEFIGAADQTMQRLAEFVECGSIRWEPAPFGTHSRVGVDSDSNPVLSYHDFVTPVSDCGDLADEVKAAQSNALKLYTDVEVYGTDEAVEVAGDIKVVLDSVDARCREHTLVLRLAGGDGEVTLDKECRFTLWLSGERELAEGPDDVTSDGSRLDSPLGVGMRDLIFADYQPLAKRFVRIMCRELPSEPRDSCRH